MMITYDGIGQWNATFINGGSREGGLVKVTDYGYCEPCGDGEAFVGVTLTAGEAEEPCTVQLGGLVTMCNRGAEIGTGWQKLVADGAGGVRLSETGHEYLVVSASKSRGIVIFKL